MCPCTRVLIQTKPKKCSRTEGRWCLFLNVCMCAYSPPSSKLMISSQNPFFLFIFIFQKTNKKINKEEDASETCKRSDFTGYKYVFVFKYKITLRGCINMFQVIFVSPKFYSVFKRVRMYIVGYENRSDKLVGAWIWRRSDILVCGRQLPDGPLDTLGSLTLNSFPQCWPKETSFENIYL